MSHQMGIPVEKLLDALHKNEAKKAAQREIDDAMKYLGNESGDEEGGSATVKP